MSDKKVTRDGDVFTIVKTYRSWTLDADGQPVERPPYTASRSVTLDAMLLWFEKIMDEDVQADIEAAIEEERNI